MNPQIRLNSFFVVVFLPLIISACKPRLATLICYNTDFPESTRQAGQAGVDILLAPCKDWESVSAQHAHPLC